MKIDFTFDEYSLAGLNRICLRCENLITFRDTSERHVSALSCPIRNWRLARPSMSTCAPLFAAAAEACKDYKEKTWDLSQTS